MSEDFQFKWFHSLDGFSLDGCNYYKQDYLLTDSDLDKLIFLTFQNETG